jgi:hypothetical protein
MIRKQPIISIDNIIRDLLPVLYKAKYQLNNNLYQLIQVFSKGSKDLYNDFITYEKDNFYELLHNAQVLSLEHQLNDYYHLPFPIEQTQSIWIGDGAYLDQTYIFLNEEGDAGGLNDVQLYLFNNSEYGNPLQTDTFLFNNSEYVIDNIDFTINYPDTITNTDYISSIVNKYRLAGYTYKLISYISS